MYSLWLTLDQDTENRLSKTINDIARQFACPVFAPHITLLGEIDGKPDTLVRAAERQLSGVAAHECRVRNVNGSDDFFTSLVLDLQLDDEFRRARSAVARDLGRECPGEYHPHISLGYGIPNCPDRCHLIERLEKTYRGIRIKIRGYSLVTAAKTTPIDEWKEVANRQFHSKPST